MASITTEVEVDIDIEDYLDEVDTKYLVAELNKRKDYKKEVGRSVEGEDSISYVKALIEKNKFTARETICDLLGMTYMTSIDDILTEIKSRIV